MMIPYGRQDISASDIAVVEEVLRSPNLTQGPAVPAFEASVSEYCGAAAAVATNSATSALHLACLALGVGPGDIVWTSPISFVASANVALYCGADVDFVDIDVETGNISIEALKTRLEDAARSGNLPKVLIPVHLCGTSCDMRSIASLSKQFGFKVIEDASHAIGGKYLSQPVGSCRYSDITVFSFHPVKIITTGEGGIAVTNSGDLAVRMRRLRSHGITREPAEVTNDPDGDWYYEQLELGFNYRMTDMQAALGISQMERLDEFVQKRHEIAEWYDSQFVDLSIEPLSRPADSYSALHLYVVLLSPEIARDVHRKVFKILREKQIGVNLHYIPIYRQPYYRQNGFDGYSLTGAEDYYRRAISIPMFPGLSAENLETVADALRSVLSEVEA